MYIRRNFKNYLFGAVLGAVAGAIFYFFQPVEWKGQALVKVGHIYSLQGNSFIEPVETAVERLKSPSFIQSVSERAKKPEVVSLLNFNQIGGLSVKQVRNGDSIIITVTGNSAELIGASIDAIAVELLRHHKNIVEEYKSDFVNELKRLEGEIDLLTQQLQSITGDEVSGNSSLSREKQLYTGFYFMQIQHELDQKWRRYWDVRDAISSKNIRPTSLIGSTYVTDQRVFSSLWRACLFGFLLGLLMSVMLIIYGTSLKKVLNDETHS